MNVDYTSLSKDNISPEPFLEQQCGVLGKFWCPEMSAEKYQKLLQNIRDYRKLAISQVDSSQRTPTNYKKTIHSYKRHYRRRFMEDISSARDAGCGYFGPS